jgi:hypothetical protein
MFVSFLSPSRRMLEYVFRNIFQFVICQNLSKPTLCILDTISFVKLSGEENYLIFTPYLYKIHHVLILFSSPVHPKRQFPFWYTS